MDLETLEKEVRAAGYIPRRSDILGIAGALLNQANVGSKAMVLLGPPGTGKSAFASAAASALKAEFVVYQCHSWSDADELFVGVDICAAVAGDSESVRQEGVLAKAARISKKKTVVLLLDEIDKTMERTEALLLDFLQTGRVPVQPGVHIQANLENILVIATSNEQREMTEAGTRRFCRVEMNPLDVHTQVSLIHNKSQVPLGICKIMWKAARVVAAHEQNHSLSIQEGIRLISAAAYIAQSKEDVGVFLSQWAARTNKGREYVKKEYNKPTSSRGLGYLIAAAWSEICKERRN
jgi:MoxR-like ATPase